MKTMHILLATIMLLSATSVSAKNHDTNAEAPAAVPAAVGQKVKSIETYKTSYIKDEQGRVVNKIIYKLVYGEWKPLGAYSVNYGEDENVLTYAQWDSVNRTFTRNASQQHFDRDEFPILLTEPTGQR